MDCPKRVDRLGLWAHPEISRRAGCLLWRTGRTSRYLLGEVDHLTKAGRRLLRQLPEIRDMVRQFQPLDQGGEEEEQYGKQQEFNGQFRPAISMRNNDWLAS